MEYTLSFRELERRIIKWAEERGIFEESDPKTQALKTQSEVGEMSDNIAKGQCPYDDIGDIVVTLILQCKMQGITVTKCLNMAWDEIKDRKGEMVNGTFVKEGG